MGTTLTRWLTILLTGLLLQALRFSDARHRHPARVDDHEGGR